MKPKQPIYTNDQIKAARRHAAKAAWYIRAAARLPKEAKRRLYAAQAETAKKIRKKNGTKDMICFHEISEEDLDKYRVMADALWRESRKKRTVQQIRQIKMMTRINYLCFHDPRDNWQTTAPHRLRPGP